MVKAAFDGVHAGLTLILEAAGQGIVELQVGAVAQRIS